MKKITHKILKSLVLVALSCIIKVSLNAGGGPESPKPTPRPRSLASQIANSDSSDLKEQSAPIKTPRPASRPTTQIAAIALPQKKHTIDELINAAEDNILNGENGVKSIVTQNPELLNQANKKGLTALHVACMENRIDVVNYLLTQDGIAVNKVCPEKDKHNKYNGNFTAAHFAATLSTKGMDSPDSTACLIALARKKADFTAKDHNGNTPFLIAARDGSTHSLKEFFLKADTHSTLSADDFLRQTNENMNNALHLAARDGRYSNVKLLAEHIDVNSQNENELTPLHLAARDCSPKCVYYLVINKKANKLLENKKGKKAIHMAKNQRGDHPEKEAAYTDIINILSEQPTSPTVHEIDKKWRADDLHFDKTDDAK